MYSEEERVVESSKETREDYADILRSIEEKYDMLYEDLGKLANLVLEIRDELIKPQKDASVVATNQSYNEWKNAVDQKTSALVRAGLFSCNREALKSVYEKMTRVYGVCWPQESTEYKEAYHITGYTHKIDVVWGKEMLRSIFDSILNGMLNESGGAVLVSQESDDESSKYGKCDDIIRPLVEKYQDSSRYGCATFHKVYSRMNKNWEINWSRATKRYINKHGSTGMTKKMVIESSPTMMARFKDSVNELMAEAG